MSSVVTPRSFFSPGIPNRGWCHASIYGLSCESVIVTLTLKFLSAHRQELLCTCTKNRFSDQSLPSNIRRDVLVGVDGSVPWLLLRLLLSWPVWTFILTVCSWMGFFELQCFDWDHVSEISVPKFTMLLNFGMQFLCSDPISANPDPCCLHHFERDFTGFSVTIWSI